jgi:uncharacterized short protein YbdD (DUF466 family)
LVITGMRLECTLIRRQHGRQLVTCQPQNNYVELHRKRHGDAPDKAEKDRKREARMPNIISKQAQKLRGIKAKIFNKKRFVEKIKIKKTYFPMTLVSRPTKKKTWKFVPSQRREPSQHTCLTEKIQIEQR